MALNVGKNMFNGKDRYNVNIFWKVSACATMFLLFPKIHNIQRHVAQVIFKQIIKDCYIFTYIATKNVQSMQKHIKIFYVQLPEGWYIGLYDGLQYFFLLEFLSQKFCLMANISRYILKVWDTTTK